MPLPTARNAVPMAAVVLPLPGPVFTMINPRRTSAMKNSRTRTVVARLWARPAPGQHPKLRATVQFGYAAFPSLDADHGSRPFLFTLFLLFKLFAERQSKDQHRGYQAVNNN